MNPETLDLVLPDWGGLDTVRRSPLPFALWVVGDQCLLHHWLDHAVNQGITSVRVFAADRPAEVRRVLGESTLWPLKIDFSSIASTADAPSSAIPADWLPGDAAPPAPANGWELIERIARLEKAWLDRMADEPDYHLLSIGFSCRIHPEAVLTPPYFIGDHVFIGPGCEIGPYAVVSQGSVVSGANRVVNSHLSAHSYLGPVTALENCRLESGILLNYKNRARIDDIEPHLVSALDHNGPSVPLKDRLQALLLYLKFRSSATPGQDFVTFDGRTLPGSPEAGLSSRCSWLPLVWRGEMPLYGVIPRSRKQLESLAPDWQNIIRHAPIGVFSYADSQGCHSPENPEEALHAVYQASLPPGALASSITDYIRKLTAADLTSHSHP